MELALLVAVIRSKSAGKSRATPFAIILHGEPGVGKSKILSDLLKRCSVVKGREYDESHVFHKNVDSDYWDGYDPQANPFIHISEGGNKATLITKSRGDPALMEITSLVDSLPHPVNMAALELKGKVFANPEVVIVDTNTPLLDAANTVNNPGALFRRFVFVESIVKAEFLKEGTCSIDPALSLAAGGDIMDRWTFNVYLKQAATKTSFKHKDILLGGSIHDLRSTMESLYTSHMNIEEKVSDKIADDDLVNAELDDLVTESYVDMFPSHWQLRHIWCYVWNIIFNVICTSLGIAILFCLLCWFRGLSYFLSSIFSGFTDYLLGVGLNYSKGYVQRKYDAAKMRFILALDKKYVMFKRSKRVQAVVASVAILVAAWAAQRAYKSYVEESFNAEASTSKFVNDPVLTKAINIIEETVDATDTVERIPVADLQQWNTRKIVLINPVNKNILSQVTSAIMRNQRLVKVIGNKPINTHILGIRGDLALINTHSFGDLSQKHWIISMSVTGEFGPDAIVKDTSIFRSDIFRVSEDISLVRISHTLFKNITDYLVTEHHEYGISTRAMIAGDSCRATYSCSPKNVSCDTGSVDPLLVSYYTYVWDRHDMGLCGTALVISHGAGFALAALHSAGSASSKYSVACAFTSKQVMDAVDKQAASSNYMTLVSEGYVTREVLLPPTLRSPLRYENLTGIEYYGRRDMKVMINQKSSLVRTKFFDSVPAIYKFSLMENGVCTMGPPHMRPFKANGIYYSPFNNAMKSMSSYGFPLKQSTLAKVQDAILKRVFKSMPNATCSPFTMDCAINGVKEDVLSRRIRSTTSAGAMFPGKKSDYIPITIEDENRLMREPVSEMKTRLLWILSQYASGVTTDVLYKAHLKDEARSEKKNAIGATRVFYASPIDVLIVQRMFLYPLYLLMMEYSDTFCTSIGINMHEGAHKLVTDMLAKFNKFLEGDYKNFDLSIPYDIKLTGATIMLKLFEHFGYNENALDIVRALLTENLFPLVEIMSDLIRVAGLQPSGKLGTAEDNSLNNLILQMYAWQTMVSSRGENLDFFEHNDPHTYGDDNLAAVSDYAVVFFNNITYRDFCLRHYGMIYTPAAKDSVMQPWLPIEEVSFLKRHFRFSVRLNRWLAPLDIKSIVKSTSFMIPSKHVSEEIQCIDMVGSSLWEYFFHCTCEADYDEALQAWIFVLQDVYGLNYEELVGELPDYTMLYNKFTKR